MPENGNNKSSLEEQNVLVEELRSRLLEDENLRNLQSDDAYLMRFLRSTNFNVQDSFNKMKMFYELLLEYPEWFTKDAPLDRKDLFDKDIRIAIPECDKEGRPIYICKIGNIDTRKMELLDVMAVDDIWMESIFETDASQNGLCAIVDISNFSWRLMQWLTPHTIKLCVKKLQCLPFKEYRFHVVNNAFLVHAGIKVIWPFLPESIKKMVKFHFDDRESLFEYINQEMLPPEYGGTNKNIDYNSLYQKLYEKNTEIAESLKVNRTLNNNC